MPDIDCGGMKVTARSNGSAAGDAFVEAFAKSCADAREGMKAWVAKLRARGVKAARYDDGWVDRKKNTVLIRPYQHFNDGAGVGDLVALGDPKKNRIVRLVGVAYRMLDGEPRWLFEEV